MCHHAFGMNTGIGSTGTNQINIRSQNGTQRFYQYFLNRNTVGLALPTVIGRSFVRNINKIPPSHAKKLNSSENKKNLQLSRKQFFNFFGIVFLNNVSFQF